MSPSGENQHRFSYPSYLYIMGVLTSHRPTLGGSAWPNQHERMCLQSHLPTYPPNPQKSYPKFHNTRTTFSFGKKVIW